MAATTDVARNSTKVRAPLWLVVGLVVGLVIAPAAAVAATLSYVTIEGTNGVKAAVTTAGQVETAPVPPTSLTSFSHLSVDGEGSFYCYAVYTAPAKFSLILKSATLDVTYAPTPGYENNFVLSLQNGCNGKLIYDYNPPSVGGTTISFGDGVVIPAGDTLYASAQGNLDTEIYGFGDLVPKADAPVETPAEVHGGAGVESRSRAQ